MFLLSLSHRGFDELEKKRRRRRRRKSLFLQVFQKYKRVRDLSARERERVDSHLASITTKQNFLSRTV